MNKKLVLETTAPFQGLAELVAYDEGLFEKEGLTIEWADREKGVDKSAQLHITDHKDAPRFASHGKMMEQGKADLYNACEWGNYSRVEGTKVKSRQIGRRSIVTYAALVVRDDSPVSPTKTGRPCGPCAKAVWSPCSIMAIAPISSPSFAEREAGNH